MCPIALLSKGTRVGRGANSGYSAAGGEERHLAFLHQISP
jgi:hypothetical protein